MRLAPWLFFIALNLAWAGDRGEIAGLVQDPSGGALVFASVTIMDQDSGIRRAGRNDCRSVFLVCDAPCFADHRLFFLGDSGGDNAEPLAELDLYVPH